MTEIDTDFVKPDQNCSNCDTEYTCFDCEREQVKTKYPNAHYEGLGVWKGKTKMNEIVECLKCHKTFEQTASLKNIVCLHCDNKDMQETVYIVQDKEERGEE